MTAVLTRDEICGLFPSDLPETTHWEQRYPPRSLPDGAEVTRFCPSPTGFAHIGGMYVAMIDRTVAAQTGGVYYIRIEDTDQEREVEGAISQFQRAFDYFRVSPDESDESGSYGSYTQSARERIYQSYVRQFLLEGKAYLCFATKEKLAASVEEQRNLGVPTGYWGRWALWRDASAEQVRERLAAGAPYVVRFRSPGTEAGRVAYDDVIRGRIESDDNRNDIVILKSSTQSPRLPTYHFAHAVDDHLMRTTTVIRSDEWLPSVPVHLQLFAAAGFDPVRYAHIAPLMKLDGSSKRKLSKRKDPEASVEFYISAGYPSDALLYYLRGLVNGRLAELPIDVAFEEPLRLEECKAAGPLVDPVKLEDISADYIAALPAESILDQVSVWAAEFDPELSKAIDGDSELAIAALGVERGDVDNPRKDLRKWSDFRHVYGYFFNDLFAAVTDPGDERFAGLDQAVLQRLCRDFLAGYRHVSDGDEWFAQVRDAAEKNGFALKPKDYKKNPEAYPGSIREAAQAIRVLLTGSTRSPGLHLVAEVLSQAEVHRRIGAVLPD